MDTVERFVLKWIQSQNVQSVVNEVSAEDFYSRYLEFCKDAGEEQPMDKIRLGQAVWNRLLPGGKVMRHAIRGRFRRLPSAPECRKWFEKNAPRTKRIPALQRVLNSQPDR